LGLGGGFSPSLPLGTNLTTLGLGGSPAGLTLSIGETFPPGTTIPITPDKATPVGTTVSIGITVPIGTGLPLGTPFPDSDRRLLDAFLPLGFAGLEDLGFLSSDLRVRDHSFRHLGVGHLSLRHLLQGDDVRLTGRRFDR